MRHYIADNGGLLRRMDNFEQRQIAQEIKTETRFEQVLKSLEARSFSSEISLQPWQISDSRLRNSLSYRSFSKGSW